MTKKLKKYGSLWAALSLSFLLSACGQPAESQTSKNTGTEKTEETNPSDSTSSKKDEKDTDQKSAQAKETQSADPADSSKTVQPDSSQPAEEKQNPTADTTAASQPQVNQKTDAASSETKQVSKDTAEPARQTAASIAGQLEQSLTSSDGTGSDIAYFTTDSGNQEAVFIVNSYSEPIRVYVTAASSGNQAEAVFDANTVSDESRNMAIHNEWTDNGNTVRVIRNNRANGNFIEVLDRYQNSAIHIENALPEQIDSVLHALADIGYPVE